jgi:hypothetical protein
MRVCIYCLQKKPDGEFNAEHVVPQSFGRFEDNLVLDCVCKECNDYFGGTLDLKLGRRAALGAARPTNGQPLDEDSWSG